jgi:hypothetical protein
MASPIEAGKNELRHSANCTGTTQAVAAEQFQACIWAAKRVTMGAPKELRS